MVRFAEKTGDLRSLSGNDLKIIALALTFHREHHGMEGIRSEPCSSASVAPPKVRARGNKGKEVTDDTFYEDAAKGEGVGESEGSPKGETAQEVSKSSFFERQEEVEFAEGDVSDDEEHEEAAKGGDEGASKKESKDIGNAAMSGSGEGACAFPRSQEHIFLSQMRSVWKGKRAKTTRPLSQLPPQAALKRRKERKKKCVFIPFKFFSRHVPNDQVALPGWFYGEEDDDSGWITEETLPNANGPQVGNLTLKNPVQVKKKNNILLILFE